MLLLVFAVVILSVSYFLIKNVKSRRFYSLASKLPGPKSYPIVGHSLQALRDKKGILNYLLKCHQEHGATVGTWLGSSLYVTLTDPKDVEVLLKDTRNLSKSDNYDFLQPWLGLGLVTSTGNHWHTHRKILTPAFHFSITEKFIDVFHEKGTILLHLLEKEVNKGVFDIYPYINLYALDAIIESAMGIKYQAQEHHQSEYVQSVHRITQLVHQRTFNPILRSKLLFPFTKEGEEQEKVLETLHSFCDKVVLKRKEELKNEKNWNDTSMFQDEFGKKRRLAFLDLLLIGQMNGSGLTDEDIRDEVNTFMFAGHDTTSSAISFAIYHLANNLKIQKSLHEEIETIFADSHEQITLTDIQNAKYLDKIVKETLRITPPIPFISRILETDLELEKYMLPAGSSASIFIHGIHQNPEIYPEPEKFSPDRFSKENTVDRHPFAYVPFSAGPRNCIGQKYGQLEIKCTLMKLIRNFEILPGESIDNIMAEIVSKPSNGFKIQLRRR